MPSVAHIRSEALREAPRWWQAGGAGGCRQHETCGCPLPRAMATQLQVGLHQCFGAAAAFFYLNNNCMPSVWLLIASCPLGLCGASEALSGWLDVPVRSASKSHRYHNPAFLCPTDTFPLQSSCSLGPCCLSALLAPG